VDVSHPELTKVVLSKIFEDDGMFVEFESIKPALLTRVGLSVIAG
jgi:hypothetical protein